MWLSPDASGRKSTVICAVVWPIEEHERETAPAAVAELAAAKTRQKIDERTLEELQKKAARAEGPERDELVRRAGDVARRLTEMVIPLVARLLADDATPEKLEVLLSENGGKLGIFSAEGGVFEVMGGRYAPKGRSGNLDVYLKGHAGDTLQVDRLGRARVFVDRPALTLGMAIQPEVIRNLGAIQGARGRGLLARFLYSLPHSTVGRRAIEPDPVPPAIREAYRARMRAMLDLEPAADDRGEHVLELAPGAYRLWVEFSKWVEPQLADFGQMAGMVDWGGKLPGAVTRIAGLLHMAGLAGDPAPWDTPISADVMGRAIRIGRYLIPHARAAFALMGCDPVMEEARYVLAWVRRQACGSGDGPASFTKRDVFEATKGRFQQVSSLEPALEVLVKHNHIRLQPQEPPRGPGRLPSPTYDINPLVQHAGGGSLSVLSPDPERPPCTAGGPTTSNSANCASPDRDTELGEAPQGTGDDEEFEECLV